MVIIKLLNTQILAIYLTLFVSSVLVQSIIASSVVPERTNSGVLILSEANIENAINENQLIVVTFYAHWCRHSKAWLPKLDEVAQKLEKSQSNVVMARIDASLEENLIVQDWFNITGFPTISLFKEGATTPELEYYGERTVDKFIKWLMFHTQES